MGKVGIELNYPVTLEIKGTIVGVYKVQDRGRVQIPPEIRTELDIKDGDKIFWVKGYDGKYTIVKAGKIG